MDLVRFFCLFFALHLLALPSWARADDEPAGDLLDEVVAVIAPERGVRTLITRSDLVLEARVVLVSRGGIEAAARDLPDDTLRAVLEWLVSEHLLLAEAEQLEVAGIDPEDLERELEGFRARFVDEEAWEAFLRQHELGRADLARIFRRRLAVDRYVASRLRLTAAVSDAEVERAWQARKATFGDSPWEWVRPRLRAQLERERREELVTALTADLRRRAEVRILVEWGEVDGTDRAEPTPAHPWYLQEGS